MSVRIDVGEALPFSIGPPFWLVSSVSVNHEATLTREKCVYRGETAGAACMWGLLARFPRTFSLANRTRSHEIEFQFVRCAFSSRRGGHADTYNDFHDPFPWSNRSSIGSFILIARDTLFTSWFTRPVRKHMRQLLLIETLLA